MRDDMDKVTVERPRHGHRDRYSRRHNRIANIPIEDRSVFDPIGKNEGVSYRTKSFSDLVGPLFKFLRRQVGRKWDDVYSEICEKLNRDSTVQEHIFNHLYQNLAVKVIVGPNNILYECDGGHIHPITDGMYVDPTTGLLCACIEMRPTWKRRIRAKSGDPNLKVISLLKNREIEFRKINGLWFFVLWDDVSPPGIITEYDSNGEVIGEVKTGGYGQDIFTSANIKYPGRYRIGKAQASSKELRKYELKNDLDPKPDTETVDDFYRFKKK